VVDADQCRYAFGQPLDKPFGDAVPRPVFARAGWWRNLDRRCVALGEINAQALQARGWRFRAGIVNADGASKGSHAILDSKTPLSKWR
jgi:hypothetical protein